MIEPRPTPSEEYFSIQHTDTTRMPTAYGDFQMRVYGDEFGREHAVLLMGAVDDGAPVPVRIHSECLTGDVFGSQRCDCGAQLSLALEKIAEMGRGALIYLRQEGRGIGLANKIRAYRLQDAGFDTVEANIRLGFPADNRDYAIAIAILRDLGIAGVRLMTKNRQKVSALEKGGTAVVERIPLQAPVTAQNRRYLQTKARRFGHLLDV